MRYILILLILISHLPAWSQSLSGVSRSARALGMGGVMIPFVKDSEALFVNPAALTQSPMMDIKVLHFDLASNQFTYDNYKDFERIDANDPSTFDSFFGEQVWARVNARAAISVPHIAVGYLRNAELAATLHNPALPSFETYFRHDEAFYLGAAFSLGPASSFGVALKRVNRWGGDVREISITDVTGDLENLKGHFENRGEGYGLDLALMTEMDAPLKPTFALVWEDVGSTQFTKTAGNDAPSRIVQNLHFGAGVGFDLPGLDFSAGVEGRHLLEPEMQIGKKIHLGAELSLPLIDLRAGFSQGYFSYGAGVNLFIFHIDAVSYKEELGEYAGQSADSRYMVSINIDLSFDANFNFTDNNGKKRRVKQRR